MAELVEGYNEADALEFIHEHLPQLLQERFDTDRLEFILDIVYEYYDIIGEDGEQEGELNLPEMLAFINESMKEASQETLSEDELKEILLADNHYMDSIDPEGGAVKLDEVADDIYDALPESVKQRYSLEDVYLLLCIEANYLDANDEVLEDDLRAYILAEAAEEELEVDAETLSVIRAVEARVLGEN